MDDDAVTAAENRQVSTEKVQSEVRRLVTSGSGFRSSLDKSSTLLVPAVCSPATGTPTTTIRLISDNENCRASEAYGWPQELIRAISSPQTGAVVSFQGTARCDVNNNGAVTVQLNYHAYEPLFAKVVLQLVEQVRRAQPEIHGIAIGHRVGSCRVGDICVIVAVSAPHRKEAFVACEVLTELLKIKAPLWKREVFASEEGVHCNMGCNTPPPCNTVHPT